MLGLAKCMGRVGEMHDLLLFKCCVPIGNMRQLFQRLRNQKINPLDNGIAVNNQNLDEVAVLHETVGAP